MTEPENDKSYIPSIEFIIPLSTTIGFLCSLIYNYGYFYGFSVDVRLLSLNDILNSFTLWAPILISITIGYLANRTLKPHRKNLFDNINTKGGPCKIVLWIIFWLLVVELSCYPLLGTSFLYSYIGAYYHLFVYISSFIVWILIILYVISHHNFKHRVNAFYLNAVTYIIFIFWTMFITGLTASSEQGISNKPNIIVYMNNKETQNKFTLLRHLEQGLLVKETDQNSYVLITWDEINRVEILPSKAFRGILRNWFKLPSVFDTSSTQ